MGASCDSHSDEPSVPRTRRTHQSPRRVRERTENSARQRELLSNKTPVQRVFPGVSAGQGIPLFRSGGQEVAGSNPASPTERTLAPQGFFSLGGDERLSPRTVLWVVFWVGCGIPTPVDGIEHAIGTTRPSGSQGVRGSNPLSSIRGKIAEDLALAAASARRGAASRRIWPCAKWPCWLKSCTSSGRLDSRHRSAPGR